MALQLVLQPGHGYVALDIVLMTAVHMWAGSKVGRARKLYNVPYPEMYADKDNKHAVAFNCVQRGHQNILENVPFFFALLLPAAIIRPNVAAGLGLVRILGFVAYMQGYSSGEPSKRLYGMFGYIGLLGLMGITVEFAVKLLC